MSSSREMPKYRCHKEVWALKIKNIIQHTEGHAVLVPEEIGYGSFSVPAFYMERHKPEIGGYFVVYKDGYKSFSPASAFEEGYTLI